MTKLETILSLAPIVLSLIGNLGRYLSTSENSKARRVGELILAIAPDVMRFVYIARGGNVDATTPLPVKDTKEKKDS